MTKVYRVIFLGINGSRDEFLARMKRLGVRGSVIDRMIPRAPVILKEGLQIKYARRYAELVQWAGGRVKIQEHGTIKDMDHESMFFVKGFDNFTICPQCGYKQDRGERCIRCGFVLDG